MNLRGLSERLFAAFPSLEVAARLAYWRTATGQRLGNWLRGRHPKVSRPQGDQRGSANFARVGAALRDLGVRSGDILIVHSSFDALKPFGLSPEAIVAELRALVGPAGTLVMPAFPLYRGEPQGLARHSDAAFDRVFDYDVRSTRIWTGALPKALLKSPGAVRSRCPANPMVALGREAEAMMHDNLSAAFLTPSGPGSALEYCYCHGARVIALGIDLVHSLTLIHVAEESFPERWQIAAWYRPRRYRVSDGGWCREVTVHERRHGWSQYYAERAFSRDLYAGGVAQRRTVSGLTVDFCDARTLVDFLVSHPRPFYPYVFPFGIRRSGTRP